MAYLGSVPSGASFRYDNASVIPGSASSPAQISANTTQDVSAAEFCNTGGADVDVYLGPNTSLQKLCTVPGVTSGLAILPRQPMMIPKGSRLSIRSSGTATIGTGSFIMNAWL